MSCFRCGGGHETVKHDEQAKMAEEFQDLMTYDFDVVKPPPQFAIHAGSYSKGDILEIQGDELINLIGLNEQVDAMNTAVASGDLPGYGGISRGGDLPPYNRWPDNRPYWEPVLPAPPTPKEMEEKVKKIQEMMEHDKKHSKEAVGKLSVRRFETGATRSSSEGKPDFEGFLSPLVIERYGEYMSKHRVLPDGALRASDNWQAGIPKRELVKSAFRHFMDWWSGERGNHRLRESVEESICALIFNASAYLHQLLVERKYLNED